MRLARSKREINIAEVVAVDRYLRKTTQLSIEDEHAVGDIFLSGDLETLVLVVGLLLGGEYANVGRTDVNHRHFKVSFAHELERVEHVLASQRSDHLYGVDRVEL